MQVGKIVNKRHQKTEHQKAACGKHEDIERIIGKSFNLYARFDSRKGAVEERACSEKFSYNTYEHERGGKAETHT